MIIENYQKLVCQTYFFRRKKISRPKQAAMRPTLHSFPLRVVFFTQKIARNLQSAWATEAQKKSCARYPLVRQWEKTQIFFARHLKAMCFPTMKTRRYNRVQLEKNRTVNDYIWYCTCRPHWYLCIFVVCIDAVCIDACIPGGDHQMSCFVVCYFHNWDFDNRPIGRLAA